MRYRVRTPDGELEYESILHVEQAYVAGLVDPEDEVIEEGGTLWRKASTIPALSKARGTRVDSWAHKNALILRIVVAALLGGVALVLIRLGYGLWALLPAFVVSSMVWRVTYKAFRRNR
jgi:Flp pilus assembly protein TadB